MKILEVLMVIFVLSLGGFIMASTAGLIKPQASTGDSFCHAQDWACPDFRCGFMSVPVEKCKN